MNTIKRECKHHGLTEFYDYGKNSCCKKCRRALRTSRYKRDPSYDANYTNQWMKDHPEKKKEYLENGINLRKKNRVEKIKIFKQNYGEYVKLLLNTFEVPYSYATAILRNIKNPEDPMQHDKIYRMVRFHKMRELNQFNVWRESTNLKYKYGFLTTGNGTTVSTYKDASLEMKERIRTESKNIGRKMAEDQIKELETTSQISLAAYRP